MLTFATAFDLPVLSGLSPILVLVVEGVLASASQGPGALPLGGRGPEGSRVTLAPLFCHCGLWGSPLLEDGDRGRRCLLQRPSCGFSNQVLSFCGLSPPLCYQLFW